MELDGSRGFDVDPIVPRGTAECRFFCGGDGSGAFFLVACIVDVGGEEFVLVGGGDDVHLNFFTFASDGGALGNVFGGVLDVVWFGDGGVEA